MSQSPSVAASLSGAGTIDQQQIRRSSIYYGGMERK